MSLPDRVGRYRILGFLASGGMAEILLAKLLGPGGFERAVVVKRVLPHLARQAEFRDMFLDEARIVARIRHPNVVDVSELGQEGRELFLVMEYLAGESVNGLMRRLASKGERLDPALAAYVIAEAAAGLHAAHELRSEDGAPLGVVHRDVSPQNIFLTYDGNVKLLDFGIAKFGDRSVETHTGQVKGKFAYMSPEQCCADRLDRRSDVFSLGILLWELVTGERLFQRANELLVWKAIVEEPIPSVSERLAELGAPPIPDALRRAIEGALTRERAARTASAADLRRDLVAALRELDPGAHAAERLAELLRGLFPDRIQQKEEMLRRVRSGDVITSVPSAEVDVELDALTEIPATRGVALPAVDTDPSARAPDERSSVSGAGRRSRLEGARRAALFGALLVFAVLVGAAMGVGWDPGSPSATSERSPTVPTAPPIASASAVASATAGRATGGAATPSTPPPEARVVHVRVETSPPGASVLVDGEPRGTTPLDLELPRGAEAVPVTLRLEGHRDHVEPIVPDVDQRIRLTLERERRRGGGGGAASGGTRRGPGEGESGGGGGDFFRFD